MAFGPDRVRGVIGSLLQPDSVIAGADVTSVSERRTAGALLFWTFLVFHPAENSVGQVRVRASPQRSGHRNRAE